MTLGSALDALLEEAPGAARERGQAAFDAACRRRPVVLVGAGNLGRRLGQAMTDDGVPPVAYADGGRALHDTTVHGVPVLPVEDAVRAHPGAAFVVSIWGARSTHRIAQTEARLRELGARCLVPFAHLAWKHRSALPHYCVEFPELALRDAERIRAAASLFADDASRLEYEAQATARLSGRFDRLGEPIPGEPYIETGLFTAHSAEVVVDGGAFDGDSLRGWLSRRGLSFAHWYAVEPDPLNGKAVLQTIGSLPEADRSRVELVCAALGAGAGRARVESHGPASRVAPDAVGDEVPVVTLDALTRRPATLVKLDIEGAEVAALEGAARVLQHDRPVFAVCVYHRHDHLWNIPLFFTQRTEGYDLFLRPHGAEGWDLVLYAVPRERRA